MAKIMSAVCTEKKIHRMLQNMIEASIISVQKYVKYP